MLRGRTGLLHMTELSNRLKPSMDLSKDLLKVGQMLDVKCIGVDLMSGAVKLSRKQLLDDHDRPLQVQRKWS